MNHHFLYAIVFVVIATGQTTNANPGTPGESPSYYAKLERVIEAALDKQNDQEIQRLLQDDVSRVWLLRAVQSKPSQIRLHVLDLALSMDSIWTMPRADIGEGVIAVDTFRRETKQTAGTLLPDLPEYDLENSGDRTALRHRLAALLKSPAAISKNASQTTSSNSQVLEASQAVASSSTPKPLATTTPLPESHGPPYLIFWLGATIIAAAAAGWLALRPSKPKL